MLLFWSIATLLVALTLGMLLWPLLRGHHVAIVEQGSKAIRQWREQHPDERLDLAKANLQDARLVGADLSGTTLVEANLSGAYRAP